MILNQSEKDEFVPALYCNQSSIEGLFSQIRMMSRDRTDLYGVGILQQIISNSLKLSNVLMKSKTYPIHNESNRSKGKDKFRKNFCLKTLCQTIKYSTMCVRKLVTVSLEKKCNGTVTYLLPRNVHHKLELNNQYSYLYLLNNSQQLFFTININLLIFPKIKKYIPGLILRISNQLIFLTDKLKFHTDNKEFLVLCRYSDSVYNIVASHFRRPFCSIRSC